MVDFNQYIRPLDWTNTQNLISQTFKPQQTPLEKIFGYLGDIQKIKSDRFDFQKKRQGFADEQEMRQLQRDMAADFRANPPKDSKDMMERTSAFLIAKGQPEKAMLFQQKAEELEVKKSQDIEANRLKADRLKSDQDYRSAQLRNSLLKIVSSKGGGMAAYGHQVLAQAGLSPETAAQWDQATINFKNSGNPSGFQALIATLQNEGKTEEAQAAMDLATQYFDMQDQSRARAGFEYRTPEMVTGADKMEYYNYPPAAGGLAPVTMRKPLARPIGINNVPDAIPDLSGVTAPGLPPGVRASMDFPPASGTTTLYDDNVASDPYEIPLASGTPGIGFQKAQKEEKPAKPRERRPVEGQTVRQFSTAFKKELVVRARDMNQVEQANQTAYNAYKDAVKRDPDKSDFHKRQLLNSMNYSQVFKYIRALDDSVVRPPELAMFRDAASGGMNPQAIALRLENWMKGETVPENVARDFVVILTAIERELEKAYREKAVEYAKSFLAVEEEGAEKYLPQVLGQDSKTAHWILSGKGALTSPSDITPAELPNLIYGGSITK